MPSRNLDAFQRVEFRVARSRRPATWEPAMAQIGQPIRRHTVIPLQEPVSPTPERIAPPPPIKSPEETPPVINPPSQCGSGTYVQLSLHHAASRSERTCEQPQARGRSCWRDHRLPGMAGYRAELVATW